MIKILAVDDMAQWRSVHTNYLNKILSDTEFSLTVKNSANEAYKSVEENLSAPYDLVITDLQMELDFEPEHAGEWLIRNIKDLPQYRNTKIITISASYDIKFTAEKYNVDYLPKQTLINNPLAYELKIKELLHI